MTAALYACSLQQLLTGGSNRRSRYPLTTRGTSPPCCLITSLSCLQRQGAPSSAAQDAEAATRQPPAPYIPGTKRSRGPDKAEPADLSSQRGVYPTYATDRALCKDVFNVCGILMLFSSIS